MRALKFFVNFFLLIMVFVFNTTVVEAYDYTSVIEQRNPVSLADSINKQSYLIRGLRGEVPLKVEAERVFNAFRLETYRGLSNEQIITRLEKARPVAIYWSAGQVGPYAFHKVNYNEAVILRRASHGKEWLLVDDQNGKVVVSLYCGNPLQDNRRVAVKTIRISPPTPVYQAPRREVVEVRSRELVEVRQAPQPQPQVVYQQQPQQTSGFNLMSLFGGFMGATNGLPNINVGYNQLPVYSGCNPAVTPGCNSSYIPQALGIGGTTFVGGPTPVTPVIGAGGPLAGLP